MPELRADNAMTLRLDWVGYEAAKLACRRWHYSGSVPAGRRMILGVWEGEAFKGVVIFSHGSTPKIGSPYELDQTQVCELTRIALQAHSTPVSRIVAVALRMVCRKAPGLSLVISYAAGEQGHHGGIYQAGGWIYEGPMDSYVYQINGELVHVRTVSSRYGQSKIQWLREHVDPHASKVRGLVRHKYLMPLTNELKARLSSLANPYPKRVKQAMAGPPAQRQCDTDPHAPKSEATDGSQENQGAGE